MKTISLAIISLFLTSLVCAQTAKKVKITELEAYIKNSDHPLVISFWATWCAPCAEEMPWLQQAVQQHADKKVELVLVSLDLPKAFPGVINDFIKQKKIEATYFWLDETNADYFCPFVDPNWEGGIPATLFINNKTKYRKFFDRQLTDRQTGPAVKELVAE